MPANLEKDIVFNKLQEVSLRTNAKEKRLNGMGQLH